MNARTNYGLEQLLAEAQERITPIVEAERHRRIVYLPNLSGAPVQDPATEQADAPWLAVVHDVLGLGPAGFHGQTLERFAGRAAHLVLVSVSADPSIYGAFAGTAAVLGRVLIVETALPLYAAWQRFLLKHSERAPLLLCVPEGGRP